MDQDWTKKSFRLQERHGWKSKPGNAICVIDRGAIRFDYPAGWDVSVEDIQVNLRDRPKPDDDCVLSVSRMHVPREVADLVPVTELVDGAMPDEEGEVLERKKARDVPRGDGVELAYGETRFIDPKEKKEAFTRLAVARGAGVYCLITFSFWAEHFAKYDPVWDEALRSLTLGLEVKDPAVGPVRN